MHARATAIRAGDIDIETPLARWFGDHEHGPRMQVAAWLAAIDPEAHATTYTAFAHGNAT